MCKVYKKTCDIHAWYEFSLLLLFPCRFHILCAYLLCEEDMSDFDPKLNSENLNKCLLSLKEFYRDLRHQRVRGRYSTLLALYYIIRG